MIQLSEILKSLFHSPRNQAVDEGAINESLRGHFHRLRGVDPETQQQWLRLRRALDGEATLARTRTRRLVPRFAVVAAIGVLVGIAGYMYFGSPQTPPDRYVTGRGERKDLAFNDGSQVTLNYSTELVVKDLRPGATRRLSLSGEAYFRVQRNETPFIVSTRYADVEVVGTEFDVRAREGGVEVGVIEGVVTVRAVKDGRDSAILLSQHQRALCVHNEFPVRMDEINSAEYPGWMHAKLILEGTSLQAACSEIEMRFNVGITIEDEGVGKQMVTGILEAQTAESAVRSLCELTGKQFSHAGETYRIY